MAKDEHSHRSLCSDFEKRLVKKTYLVLADGIVNMKGVISGPLREFASGRTAVHPKGKSSLTTFRVKKRFKGATLLEVDLVTGRRHQIRAHLYNIGHPVMGDTVYGAKRPVGGASRLMLHAWRLKLPRLDSVLEAPLPEDFLEELKKLTPL